MKPKLLIAAALGLVATADAYAACPVPSCPLATPDSSCSISNCCSSSTSTTNGVITTSGARVVLASSSCPNSGTYSCRCDSTTTYTCAAGYYGNPTSSSSGCTACPDGYTSPAGSTSASDCEEILSVGGTVCKPLCPYTSWTSIAPGYDGKCNELTGDCAFRCAKGYYGTPSVALATKSGCEKCPSMGGIDGTTTPPSLSRTVSVEVTECYVPSGTTFSDISGSGSFTSACYYSE